MRILILCCALLAGCSEYKCINGRVAHRSGDVWVIPPGTYECVEVNK